MHLSILDGFISCKIYDKRDDFDFEIVNFPYLNGDVPRRSSCVFIHCISQLIRFSRVSSHVTDFNTQNKLLSAKLLNRVIGTINSAKLFFLNLLTSFRLSFKIQCWTEISNRT